MDSHDSSEYQVIRERIKEKPINVKKLLGRFVLILLGAALAGAIAAFVFISVVNHMLPEVQTVMVNIPPDERISPSDKVVSGNSGKSSEEEGNASDTAEGQQATEAAQEGEATVSEDQSQIPEPQIINQVTEHVSLTTEDYRELYRVLREAARNVEKSLVTVTSTSSDRDWFDNTYENTDRASGLIVANNGIELLILTEMGVSDNAEKMSVTFCDGTMAEAEVKSIDGIMEMEVIAVKMEELEESTLTSISEAKLGNSWVSSIVGSPVMAVGSPFGTPGGQAFGLITSNSQELSMQDRNVRLIGTDIYGSTEATGVLATYEGEVIGIISQGASTRDTVNLIVAYSISDLKELIEKLSNGTKEARLGVQGTDVTADVHQSDGVPIGAYVTKIIIDSPAMDAGIQSGDVITKIGTTEVKSFNDLTAALMKCQPKDKTVVTVQRFSRDEYAEMTFEVTLGSSEGDMVS
ncbi:MAG: S1C family serine protease [Lachnospiraceae bacterium]|nr:S1C family serine protease [Lachnospiraceae bacterium]